MALRRARVRTPPTSPRPGPRVPPPPPRFPLPRRRAQWRPVRRAVAFLAALVIAGTSHPAPAGAPRDGDVFANPGGSRPWPGTGGTLPFFARKVWTSGGGRGGRAPQVAHDP